MPDAWAALQETWEASAKAGSPALHCTSLFDFFI